MQINPSALIEQYHRSIGSRLTSASLTKEFGVNNSNNVPNYLPLHHRERRKRLEDAINVISYLNITCNNIITQIKLYRLEQWDS